MDVRAEYLLLLGACLLITLPLEFVFRARVYRRPRALLLALLPVVVVYSVWDLVGIHRDHWRYEPTKVTGWQLPGGMPVEELAFFIVIPVCGLLTLEAVRWMLGVLAVRRDGSGDA